MGLLSPKWERTKLSQTRFDMHGKYAASSVQWSHQNQSKHLNHQRIQMVHRVSSSRHLFMLAAEHHTAASHWQVQQSIIIITIIILIGAFISIFPNQHTAPQDWNTHTHTVHACVCAYVESMSHWLIVFDVLLYTPRATCLADYHIINAHYHNLIFMMYYYYYYYYYY